MTHLNDEQQNMNDININEINIDNISIKQAENTVQYIFSRLSNSQQKAFADEWAQQVKAVHPEASSSLRAVSGADVVMIAYAQRFLKV